MQTTAKQDAATLRKDLKKHLGYTSKQVSVRKERCTLSSTFHVTVKVPVSPEEYAKIEALARSFESIDRCNVTGGILSGGNRFVNVRLSAEVETLYTKAIEAELENGRREWGELTVRQEGRNWWIDRPGFPNPYSMHNFDEVASHLLHWQARPADIKAT